MARVVHIERGVGAATDTCSSDTRRDAMKYSAGLASVLALVAGARAGTTIWSGSFNSYATVAAFDNCEVAFMQPPGRN